MSNQETLPSAPIERLAWEKAHSIWNAEGRSLEDIPIENYTRIDIWMRAVRWLMDTISTPIEKAPPVAPTESELLKRIHKTCLCTDATRGFDYGENHKRLGTAGPGKRWLTPRDLIQSHWTKADKLAAGGNDE